MVNASEVGMHLPDGSQQAGFSHAEKNFLESVAYFLLQTGQPERGLGILKALKRFFPDDHTVCGLLSFAALECGDPEVSLNEAIHVIDKAHTAEQRHQGTVMQSRALWMLGRKQEAGVVFRRLVRK